MLKKSIQILATAIVAVGLYSLYQSYTTNRMLERAAAAPTGLTKAQWKAKLAAHDSTFSQTMSTVYVENKALVNAVGEPDNISVIGQRALLTWHCSDGAIVLDVNNSAMNYQAMAIGNLSEF